MRPPERPQLSASQKERVHLWLCSKAEYAGTALNEGLMAAPFLHGMVAPRGALRRCLRPYETAVWSALVGAGAAKAAFKHPELAPLRTHNAGRT